MSKNPKLFEVLNLGHSYGDNKVFENLSISLEEGKFYTILGENGSGKSTFMRLISGIENVDSGSVKVRGLNTYGENFQVHNPIALITEDLNFEINDDLDVLVKYFSTYYPDWSQKRFDNYLTERSFSLDRTFASMSRGQKVQFSLMLYLSSGVKTFVVDEITSVLDLYARNFFLKELRKVTAAGGTVIFATNIITEVQHYTDHVVLLGNKSVRLDMTIDSIPKNFVKLRRLNTLEHPIYKDPTCFWSGENSDGSASYIVSKETFKKYDSPEEFVDRRGMTLNDIFVFYFKTELEVESENAA